MTINGFSLFTFMPLFTLLFSVVFFGIFGFIVYNLAKSAKRERQNDKAPQLTVECTIVTKRLQVRGDHSHTTYYVTFQVASGDRMELPVPHNQYGLLVEGDHGKLTFQGTRYLQFERM